MRNVLAPLEDNETFVSTGQLPDPQKVTAIVTEAYEHFRSNPDGKNSDVYPALQRASSNLFGVCVVATGGNVFAIGDADYEFAIMSVSKPFVFALVCQRFGADAIRRKVGANATGLPFNSLSAVEGSTSGLTNPMVNAGAIATTSLVPGSSPEAKWEFICNGLLDSPAASCG